MTSESVAMAHSEQGSSEEEKKWAGPVGGRPGRVLGICNSLRFVLCSFTDFI